MTVQIVENWADIKGELLESYPSKTADGFITLEVKAKDVKDVKGYRNLLADRVGEVIQVNVPESVWQSRDIKPGPKVSMRVRISSSRKLFVHPEHLRVE
jgi:hypothetical protein